MWRPECLQLVMRFGLLLSVLCVTQRRGRGNDSTWYCAAGSSTSDHSSLPNSNVFHTSRDVAHGEKIFETYMGLARQSQPAI